MEPGVDEGLDRLHGLSEEELSSADLTGLTLDQAIEAGLPFDTSLQGNDQDPRITFDLLNYESASGITLTEAGLIPFVYDDLLNGIIDEPDASNLLIGWEDCQVKGLVPVPRIVPFGEGERVAYRSEVTCDPSIKDEDDPMEPVENVPDVHFDDEGGEDEGGDGRPAGRLTYEDLYVDLDDGTVTMRNGSLCDHAPPWGTCPNGDLGVYADASSIVVTLRGWSRDLGEVPTVQILDGGSQELVRAGVKFDRMQCQPAGGDLQSLGHGWWDEQVCSLVFEGRRTLNGGTVPYSTEWLDDSTVQVRLPVEVTTAPDANGREMLFMTITTDEGYPYRFTRLPTVWLQHHGNIINFDDDHYRRALLESFRANSPSPSQP